ncbi:MAG: Bug family tripartite tricarboxylate transporter substrate binding protein [Thermodesulfobacteriota bacterium]
MRSFIRGLKIVLLIALVTGFSFTGALFAQEIKGPIKIIVPYPAGGGSDVQARLVADKMKDSLGQAVIVENKPGAGGQIGAEYAKNQPADGTAMLVVNPALFVVAPAVFPKLAYNPDTDFAPVSLLSTYQFCVSVPITSTVKDVKGLIEWIRKNPNQANFGSPAAGSLPHFFGLLIGKVSGVEMVHTSYNGSGPLTTALIGGQIPIGVDAYDTQSVYHPDKIRILATAGTSRKKADIPTFKEQGFPEIEGIGWNAVVVPAKTPKGIIDKLSKAIADAAKMPDVIQKIQSLGSDPVGSTPDEFAKTLKKDREHWVPVIKASGFKVQ